MFTPLDTSDLPVFSMKNGTFAVPFTMTGTTEAGLSNDSQRTERSDPHFQDAVVSERIFHNLFELFQSLFRNDGLDGPFETAAVDPVPAWAFLWSPAISPA